MKNVLDYTEDLSSDTRVYFDGLAVGCIACAGGWQAAGQTLAAHSSDYSFFARLANSTGSYDKYVRETL